MQYLLTILTLLGVLSGHLLAQPGIGYDFDQPELLAEMPKVLKEISGLSPSPEEGEFLAVQDEKGKFFRLDLADGRLLGSTEFWKDGDYEGIEAVGNDIWVVKNTGTLYRVTSPGLASQEVTKFNGFLNSDNDVEGLAYDKVNRRLLLVCKSHSIGSVEVRSIFAFDLEKTEFLPRPVYSIGRLAIRAYLEQCPKTSKHAKIVSFINEREDYDLGPSAIAIHPVTGQMFIVSSVGKLLIVLGSDGKIQHIRKLKKSIFPQPEGLLFLPDGTLYVSTEARGDDPAKVYKLNYQPGFKGS